MTNRMDRRQVQLAQSLGFIDEYNPEKSHNIADDSAFMKKMKIIKFNEFTIGQHKRVHNVAYSGLEARRRIDKEIARQVLYRSEVAHELAMNPEEPEFLFKWRSIDDTIRVLKSLVDDTDQVRG